MHFHLLKDSPYAPALPRAALAAPVLAHSHRSGSAATDWSALLSKILRRWQNNRTVATLNSMDDRLLRDIGLRRDDIHSYVAEIDPRSPSSGR